MTRTLIDETDGFRTYEVRDDDGNVVGTDTEWVGPTEPTPEERLAAVEDAIDTLILDALMGGL